MNEKTDKSDSKSRNLNLFLGSIFLGILFDILFFKKTLGISYLIFVIGFYGIFLWVLGLKVSVRFNFGWFLSIPVIALSSTYLFFTNPIFSFINFFLIPILIVAQTLLITGENKHNWFGFWFMEDVFLGFFTRSFSHIHNIFLLDLTSQNGQDSNKKSMVVKKILIGLLISVPLLVVIFMLLRSADLVFSNFMKGFVDWLKKINWKDFFAQLFIFLFVCFVSFSYLWSFLKHNLSQNQKSNQEELGSKKTLDPIISITVLVLVNLIYLLFISVQFAYMLGAYKNGLPPDITYAQYARKGFFELLTVTLINFIILLVGIIFKPKQTNLIDKSMKTLHSVLILSTIVLLVSAFLRMSLYEAAYGFTYLRILTQSFMMLLFVLFIVALGKIWNDRIGLLKSYIVISLIAYLIVNFANIDVLITKNNIARYHKTGELDIHYLQELSFDSMPFVLELYKKSVFPPDLVYYFTDINKELTKNQKWQSFNFSKWKTKKALSDSIFR